MKVPGVGSCGVGEDSAYVLVHTRVHVHTSACVCVRVPELQGSPLSGLISLSSEQVGCRQ